MLFQLMMPYFFLMVIIAFYLLIRKSKLGNSLLKIDRYFFNRYSGDSFLIVIVMAVAAYFLMRHDLSGSLPDAEGLPFGVYTYAIFYPILLLVVVLREIEKPTIREKGISTPRGFWLWTEIDAYRWNKNVLTVSINRGRRPKNETWLIKETAKKEVDQYFKNMVPKKSTKKKK